MTDIETLIRKCKELGATLTSKGDCIHIQASEPLPNDLVHELKALKPQILRQLENDRRKSLECWMLEEWSRTAIPSWRKILQESIEQCDSERADYARWMLRDVLVDSDYVDS